MELLDNEIYLEEIADIICIALAELPWLLQVHEIVEILLDVSNGRSIIRWIVASTDCFSEVVTSLIVNSDEDTPEEKLRLTALSLLCEINPAQALSLRVICVQLEAMLMLIVPVLGIGGFSHRTVSRNRHARQASSLLALTSMFSASKWIQ